MVLEMIICLWWCCIAAFWSAWYCWWKGFVLSLMFLCWCITCILVYYAPVHFFLVIKYSCCWKWIIIFWFHFDIKYFLNCPCLMMLYDHNFHLLILYDWWVTQLVVVWRIGLTDLCGSWFIKWIFFSFFWFGWILIVDWNSNAWDFKVNKFLLVFN